MNRPVTNQFAACFTMFLFVSASLACGQDSSTKFPSLEFKKWSGKLNVPDPVALSVDNQGRVFVTQTKRRKIQDLDIRQHQEWIPSDVGLRSVQEKSDFLKTVLAIGGDPASQSKHVDDWNRDGQHDWRDLAVVSEVIYRVVDSDDDGTADELTVFVEDFKTEVTGIAAGIMAFEGDVYATVAPDLWKLNDADDDGIADSQVSIAHGFGLHIAYAGHDMHGLTVGPDGKIYWSIGDKGIHVTTDNGKPFSYPDQGGVLRCNPDGSDFEVFAHGLRNVQELAFDQYGNLFSVDNDSDQPGEKERFVYIVDAMDAGWRCYYQYRGDEYNAWTDEHLWDLPGEDHPAYIVPPLSHYIDGPAGFKFNPGTALSPAYKSFFFLTGAPNGSQFAFRAEPSGDSFKMIDDHQIGSGIAIVGLAFGPDGALYGADWDGGYPLDEKGSVIRIDVAGNVDSEARRETKQLLAAGFSGLEKTRLAVLLAHADMRVRMGAQFALVKLNAADILASVAMNVAADELARLHGLWGLGQLGRAGDTLARDSLGLLMQDSNSRVRGQAAKTYGELRSVDGMPLIKLLSDDDPHVRTFAGLALGRQPSVEAVEKLLEQADKMAKDQHYVRHSIVTALSKCATAEQLAEHTQHENELRRLSCVLALRRQGSAAVAGYLSDPSDWVATAAARAIHDDESIFGALSKLAIALEESPPGRPEAFVRRAINANFRLGDAGSASRLLSYASLEAAPMKFRSVALDCLASWYSPPVLDRVEGIRRDLPLADRTLEGSPLNAVISQLVGSREVPVRNAALKVAQELDVVLPLDTLHALLLDDSIDDQTRVLALDSLSQQWNDLIVAASKSSASAVRMRALQILSERGQGGAITELRSTIESDPSLLARQSAIQLLGSLDTVDTRDYLIELGESLRNESLAPELALDVFNALENVTADDVRVKKLLADIRNRPSGDQSQQSAKYAFSRDGGDSERGAKIFRTHVQAQCSRCHKIGKQGSEIGPELTSIAKVRDADYLLRSIVSPSADIDAKYRSQLILLESGQVVKGVVQNVTETETIIADAEGKLQTLITDEIEEMTEQSISLMPEMTEILSPREVRDLVAYLRQLR